MVVAVPGLTVPWSHTVYLWLATALSFCAHEVSHHNICLAASQSLDQLYPVKGESCQLIKCDLEATRLTGHWLCSMLTV